MTTLASRSRTCVLGFRTRPEDRPRNDGRWPQAANFMSLIAS
jgi:hypothetical protein